MEENEKREYHIGNKIEPLVAGKHWGESRTRTEVNKKKKKKVQKVTLQQFILLSMTMITSILLLGFTWTVERSQESWTTSVDENRHQSFGPEIQMDHCFGQLAGVIWGMINVMIKILASIGALSIVL